MENAIGDRALKRLTQKTMNIIDGSVSRYCAILNSTERLHIIKQANELASVICDIYSDRLGEKGDRKKRYMESQDQSNNKYEQYQMRDYEDMLKGIETCEVFVCSVLTFFVDHINDLKVKDIRVLLSYHFVSEKLKGIPKKVEMVEAVKYF